MTLAAVAKWTRPGTHLFSVIFQVTFCKGCHFLSIGRTWELFQKAFQNMSLCNIPAFRRRHTVMEKRMTIYIQKKGNDRRFLFRTDLQNLPDTRDRIAEFRNLL